MKKDEHSKVENRIVPDGKKKGDVQIEAKELTQMKSKKLLLIIVGILLIIGAIVVLYFALGTGEKK